MAAAGSPAAAGTGSPELLLPGSRVEAAVAAAHAAANPRQYAVAIGVGAGLPHGSWSGMPDGRLAWRLALRSAGAVSMSLRLVSAGLPDGAEIRVSSPDRAVTHGPYRAGDISPHGLWTPVVPGEALSIEVRVPAAQAAAVQLAIPEVYHGFRSFRGRAGTGGQKAGACNVDVACPADGAWDDEVRAVALVQINGTVTCSGQLVNNTRQDLDPLLLTAHHCGITDAADAASVVLYFNYQSPECAGPRAGPDSADSVTGATLVAGDAQLDFTLIRMLQSLPPHLGVYFSGWDATGQASECGVGIHHPDGAEKSISYYSARLGRALFRADTGHDIEAWQVNWSRGVTEPGSSGSGLWSQEHKLVGVLSGGESSCDRPRGADYYARLQTAWSSGSEAGTRLRANLDPASTGRLKIPGRDQHGPPGRLDEVSSTHCGAPDSAVPTGQGGAFGAGLAVLLPLLLARRRRVRPHRG